MFKFPNVCYLFVITFQLNCILVRKPDLYVSDFLEIW